ncbi:MAG: hypothetical protein RIM99_10220 [Cyclobacteriaceae bacterium]
MTTNNRKFLNTIRVNRTKNVSSVLRVSSVNKTPEQNLEKVQGGMARPSLSDLLKSYLNIIHDLKTDDHKQLIHQLEINAFEVEVSTGMSGFENNELKLKI